MGMTAYNIQEHIADVMKLAQIILDRGKEIDELQSECVHCWHFNYQVNACHEKIWHVMYKCDECTLVKVEKKEPVCEKCDVALVRCDASDAEAEAERIKPEFQGHMNAPLAFRCPECRKIHILWHQGD